MKKDKSMEKEILMQAERLFLKKGFALTSTTEIARESGCNQALVHYYFRTKDKLFEAVFKNKMIVFISSFLQIDQRDVSFEEKLVNKIEAHFDVLCKNQELPFLIINELITNPDRIASLKEQVESNIQLIYSSFSQELDAEIQKGKIRPISALDLFLSILSLNISVFLLKPLLKDILSIDDEQFNRMAEERKKENVRTILMSLKPQ